MKAILFVAVLFAVFSLPAVATEPLSGEIRFLKGRVFVDGKPARVGTRVHQGQKIRSETASLARLVLSGGVGMQVGPETTLALTGRAAEAQPLVVDLLGGQLLSTVAPAEKKAGGSRYEVRTKEAALGVRGTSFFVKRNAQAEGTFVCFCTGSVSARWAQGAEEISAKHHDQVFSFGREGRSREADMGHDHSDAEIEALSSLVREKK